MSDINDGLHVRTIENCELMLRMGILKKGSGKMGCRFVVFVKSWSVAYIDKKLIKEFKLGRHHFT